MYTCIHLRRESARLALDKRLSGDKRRTIHEGNALSSRTFAIGCFTQETFQRISCAIMSSSSDVQYVSRKGISMIRMISLIGADRHRI